VGVPSRGPGAATVVEATVAALRSRAGSSPRSSSEGGEEPSPETAPGEALREAVTDVLFALSVTCRDRLARRDDANPSGPLASMSPDAAAGALERLALLTAHVRRNVAPTALLLDAVLALQRGR
jgi:hypothetical protein